MLQVPYQAAAAASAAAAAVCAADCLPGLQPTAKPSAFAVTQLLARGGEEEEAVEQERESRQIWWRGRGDVGIAERGVIMKITDGSGWDQPAV
jgi:hypothetical protein